MPEVKIPVIPEITAPVITRRANLADFFGDDDEPSNSKGYKNNNNGNDDRINKNQQEFGQRKRIKP